MEVKTVFIEAKSDVKIDLKKIKIDKLPDKIGLVSTVQFLDYLKEIKNFLKKKKVLIAGQILGCNISNAEKIKNKVDAFLYIGTGNFHPIALAKTKKQIFIFNPISNIFSEFDKREAERYEKRRKGAMLKFLSAKNIGILVSTKPGQNNFKKAVKFKNKLKNKNCCIFLFDTLDKTQLENFPFIEAWVNTACPRIADDINCVNIEDVSTF